MIKIENLSCDFRFRPIDVDCRHPVFGWVMDQDQRGARQTAYRIQVASNLQRLLEDRPDMWDSGMITSRQSSGVPYNGVPLQSHTEYAWRVTVWDGQGQPAVSDVEVFETAFMNESEWEAGWLSYPGGLAGESSLSTDHSGGLGSVSVG